MGEPAEVTQFERPTDERLPAERVAAALQAEGSIFLNVAKFEHAQRVAAMFANSTMVPEHYRGNVGNCMIALNLADRFRADPFMLMQTTYVVHGKPGLEGKLVAALINHSGKYRRELRYRWLDPKDQEVDRHVVLERQLEFGNHGCQAYTEDHNGNTVEGPKITWAIVKAEGWWGKSGSKWQTMPELMFKYRAASWFANINCPDVKMGMATVEEIRDVVDLRESVNGSWGTETGPSLKDRVEAAKKEEKKADTHPDEDPGQTFREEWINLRAAGFSTYVFKNLERFRIADSKDQAEAREKWQKLYGASGDPWPLDEQTEEPPAEPEQENTPPPMIPCPEREDSRVIPEKMCPECRVKDDCQSYYEYLNGTPDLGTDEDGIPL
jgi:hypothetical protein